MTFELFEITSVTLSFVIEVSRSNSLNAQEDLTQDFGVQTDRSKDSAGETICHDVSGSPYLQVQTLNRHSRQATARHASQWIKVDIWRCLILAVSTEEAIHTWSAVEPWRMQGFA